MIDRAASTFADWLEWMTVYQRWMLSLTLTTEGGGLATEGLAMFDAIRQRPGDVWGLELAGLMFWFREPDVIGVVIEQSSDTIAFTVRDQATFCLRPLFSQDHEIVL